MGYQYFALLDIRDFGVPTQVSDAQEIALRGRGLRSCLDAQRVHLFVANDTPVLVLSNDRVLVGHLFDRSGRLVRDGSGFLEARSDAQLAEDLLQNYWGEYIVICHGGNRAHELTILREPSGGMPAIYAFQEGSGFVTSDISIAIELGLHKRQIDWTFISTFLAFPNLKTATTALLIPHLSHPMIRRG